MIRSRKPCESEAPKASKKGLSSVFLVGLIIRCLTGFSFSVFQPFDRWVHRNFRENEVLITLIPQTQMSSDGLEIYVFSE